MVYLCYYSVWIMVTPKFSNWFRQSYTNTQPLWGETKTLMTTVDLSSKFFFFSFHISFIFKKENKTILPCIICYNRDFKIELVIFLWYACHLFDKIEMIFVFITSIVSFSCIYFSKYSIYWSPIFKILSMAWYVYLQLVWFLPFIHIYEKFP